MTKRPKAWNDAFTVGEDATAILAVLANDRTPPDDPLRIVKLTGHDLHGAVTVATNGQNLLWHDDAFDFLAECQTQLLRFKYVALTEDGDRVRATVRLTDDAPSAGADQTVTVADNIADTVPIATVVGSDVDQGAVLAYSLNCSRLTAPPA
jgi:Bacterial cadherin-like domain